MFMESTQSKKVNNIYLGQGNYVWKNLVVIFLDKKNLGCSNRLKSPQIVDENLKVYLLSHGY